MSKSLVDILKKRAEEKEKYFKNYLFYCKKIKEEAEKILGKVEVIVFGSVVKNEYTPLSDIDVLIISDNLPNSYEERIKIKTEIKSKIDSFSPFQIHLSNYKEYNNWYKKFIKNDFMKI
ncbi:MAG TPA: nucleotidyltransferase domain-containing protein [bacterium]|nr:nucleotidyltransferase domain-containing protein [bacterium]HOM26159.1 nucleotidyltransferase domain-containing protein [bacterium]